MFYYTINNTVCASRVPLDGFPEAPEKERANVSVYLFTRDMQTSRSAFLVNDPSLLSQETEGAFWLSASKLREAASQTGAAPGGGSVDTADFPDEALTKAASEMRLRAVNTAFPGWEERLHTAPPFVPDNKKKTVHILAVGDVGSGVLTGLHLLGGDVIEKIGIFDVAEKNVARWEFEINQITEPWAYDKMPEVYPVTREHLFDCDVFLFTASAGIPPVGSDVKDVRMFQFEKNAKIISEYARQARDTGFRGLFCAISDPVDPLAKAAFLASNTDENGTFDGKGLLPEQIQSFGLGVMNARAAYYAKRDKRFTRFLSEGRAFGPHGKELVIADSIDAYDEALSGELTALVVNANMKMRELGFKPFVAPAYSSAALSILLTLRGAWHYGGVFLGGIYMGCKNRYTPNGQEIEILDLPDALFEKIAYAEKTLHDVN